MRRRSRALPSRARRAGPRGAARARAAHRGRAPVAPPASRHPRVDRIARDVAAGRAPRPCRRSRGRGARGDERARHRLPARAADVRGGPRAARPDDADARRRRRVPVQPGHPHAHDPAPRDRRRARRPPRGAAPHRPPARDDQVRRRDRRDRSARAPRRPGQRARGDPRAAAGARRARAARHAHGARAARRRRALRPGHARGRPVRGAADRARLGRQARRAGAGEQPDRSPRRRSIPACSRSG